MNFLCRLLGYERRSTTLYSKIKSEKDDKDSLIFLFETYLAEYDSIRRQIELNLQLAERSIEYLLTLFGAILLTSQVFTQSTIQVTDIFRNNPLMYLVLASISLWFPMENLFKNAHIAVLGKYEYYVIAPKLNAIASYFSRNSQLNYEYSQWESKQYPEWLRGTLKWEEFRAKAESGTSLPLFAVVGILRYIFLSAPSLLFVIAFISIKSLNWANWSYVERAVVIIFVIITFSLLIGFISTIRDYLSFAFNEKVIQQMEIKEMNKKSN